MFELVDNQPQNAVIKVIGVGGGGGNAVKHMISSHIEGVDFICANTDAKALNDIDARTVLQLGSAVTKGLGAGANPDIGRQAAMEDKDRIAEVLKGTDIVFITAGMGGGTGTGGAPVVAEVAKELGILTVAVVTKPFRFEGSKRMRLAEEGIRELAQYVDSLITIPNQKLEAVLGRKIQLTEAFREANNVLHNAVQGIAELITKPGMIGVDFADVRTVMSEMGMAMMGSGVASGEDRAIEAARAAISSPLLEDINLQGARGILVNITANESLELGEFSDVGEIIEEFASENATIVMGTAIDPNMGDEIKVTVVATGLGIGELIAARQETAKPSAAAPVKKAEPPVLSNPAEKPEDYGRYDTPALGRVRPRAQVAGGSAQPQADNMEYLDIPAFLRRQAD
ncbi:MAG TPA: cell division protein FtsZ [Pseudomonadales bacterium]